MLKVFMWVLLIIYFWYFYYFESKPLAPPNVPGPNPAQPFDLRYSRLRNDEFQFKVNGTFVWSQKVPFYLVTRDTIQEMDECYQSIQYNQTIPAKGLNLYNFVRKNPKFQSLIDRHKNKDYGYIAQHGTPFFFTCQGKQIASLTLCPPGHIFENGECKMINSCTGQPDNTRFPHPDPHQYIYCQDGQEQIRQCVPGQVFYGGNCISETERLCVLQKDLSFFKFDDFTLFGCQNHIPIYKTCPPGTRLFDSAICEPSDCFGKADHEKIPLRKRKRIQFEYSSGYSVCQQGKIARTEFCSQVWDPMLAEEEDLTMFPMVFDASSRTCSVPSLCKNVWPTDSNINIRAHEYTRILQNWFYSKFYDQGKGYFCDTNGQKQDKVLPVGTRIDQHFKVVPLCNDHDPSFLPLNGYLNSYYDCNQLSFQTCPPNHFFDGSVCKPTPDPKDSPIFKYQNKIPLFQFDSLDSEGWIEPHAKHSALDLTCEAGYEYVKMYHVCSHPLCVPFAFLSMIPELSLFIPPHIEKAKCTFEESKRYVRKITTSLNYTFWDQKIRHEKEIIPTENCQFGQRLKTGNYIWDRTVYATCDDNQPFIFCPSTHTRQILRIPQDTTYACAPPQNKTFRHDTLGDHVNYGMNKFKRILRVDKSQSTQVLLNKNNVWYEVPENGLDIPIDTRLNLKSIAPVDLEYKYRVTYPPHVIFEYTDTGRNTIVSDNPSKIFNIKSQQFEYGKFKFPRYRVKTFVAGFQDKYDP